MQIIATLKYVIQCLIPYQNSASTLLCDINEKHM